MVRVKTYADPVLDPWSASPYAPTTTVFPSIETLLPNSSPAAPSFAVSLATCVQPEARSPAVSRVNTYADPLDDPITIVSPSIETLMPNTSS